MTARGVKDIGGIVLDLSRWPRVHVTVKWSPTNQELRDFMEAWADAIDEHDAPFVIVIDVLAVERFSAVQRALVMEAINHRSESGRGSARGIGLVLASEFMRTLMNVMLQAVPTDYPVRAFEDCASAGLWLDELVASRPSLAPPATST